jgi:cysteine desulfurase/selenocysteine lyase
MAHGVTFDHAQFETGALKYQAGTPDVAGPVGLAAAMRLFDRVGQDAIQRHDEALVAHGLARLRELSHVRVIGSTRSDRRVPVFTFVVPGVSANSIASQLDGRGIAVRAGDMAALPLLNRFGVTEAVRASAYVYSTTGDLDRLTEGLRSIAVR